MEFLKAFLVGILDFFKIKKQETVDSSEKDETPWMSLAEKEIGTDEYYGAKHNLRILEYHKATTLKADDDETPWCSSFVTWALENSGYKSTKEAWARSYLNYGTKLDKPKYGCIVVYDRGDGKGHVHFFVKETQFGLIGLGGNQDNTVKLKEYPKNKVLGYRWPVKKENKIENDSITLSWEAGNPQRKEWSKTLLNEIESSFDILSKAKDITFFIPKFDSYTKAQKIKAIAEIFVATAYYESGYNPKSQSVDVGTKDNKDTWSVGLYQMSVVDQKNYGLNLGYDFNDLNIASPNIILAVRIMAKQIAKKGLFVVTSGPYWAVLYRGKYSKVDQIQARVKDAL